MYFEIGKKVITEELGQCTYKSISSLVRTSNHTQYSITGYEVSSPGIQITKLERFLAKKQHTQR